MFNVDTTTNPINPTNLNSSNWDGIVENIQEAIDLVHESCESGFEVLEATENSAIVFGYFMNRDGEIEAQTQHITLTKYEDKTEAIDYCYEGFIGGYGLSHIERDEYDPNFDDGYDF